MRGAFKVQRIAWSTRPGWGGLRGQSTLVAQVLTWAIYAGPGLGRYAPRRWLDAAPWKGLPLGSTHLMRVTWRGACPGGGGGLELKGPRPSGRGGRPYVSSEGVGRFG